MGNDKSPLGWHPIPTIVSVAVGLIVSPIIGFFGAVWWYEIGGRDTGGIFGCVLGIVAFFITVYAFTVILRRGADKVYHTIPRLLFWSVAFGLLAVCLVTAVMLVSIVLLGHARPAGWEFQNIPLAASIGFMIGLAAGLILSLVLRKKSVSIFR